MSEGYESDAPRGVIADYCDVRIVAGPCVLSDDTRAVLLAGLHDEPEPQDSQS